MGLFSIRKTNTVFYNSGEIEIVYQTLNNQLDGWYKIYHKNGQLKTIVNYKKNIQIDEIVKSYDEKGNLVRLVEIKNNELNGPFKEFYSSGNLKCEGYYKDGQIIDKKAFYENSTLKYHYLKSANESESKIFDEDLNYLKNNLEKLPKYSVLYTSNNDFEIFLFDTYESAQIKFERISNKILDISKEYEINEISNPDFIELVELCELLEIPQKSINSLISIEDKNELIELWHENHSESSHRYLSKFTSLINDNIELRKFDGRTYIGMSDLQQNINYIPIEYLDVANSKNFIDQKKLINNINSIKHPTTNQIESLISQCEYKNLFHVVDIVVSYIEIKLTENNITIDDFFYDLDDSQYFDDSQFCINIIIDYLGWNEPHDFNIPDIMYKFDSISHILKTEIAKQKEDIEINKAYNHNVNLLYLVNHILKNELIFSIILEGLYVKHKKTSTTSTIEDRLKEINDINTSNYINYNKLENLLKSILFDIENNNFKDVDVKNDLLYFDYGGEKIEINAENLYFDYCTSLYYQDKYLNCLVACEHLINKFPNTNNSSLFGIMGELYMQISRYDKAAIYYNLCITNLFNENYNPDFSSQILHFCNRAQSFLMLFEYEKNEYINNIINDLDIYVRYYPNDEHAKDLYNKMIYQSNSENKVTKINDFFETVTNDVINLRNEGREDEIKNLFVELALSFHKEGLRKRILKSKEIKKIDDGFYELILKSKSFISQSTLSTDLICKLMDLFDFLEKYSKVNIDLEKKIDILYLIEHEYNDEVFLMLSEDNISKDKLSEVVIHGEFIQNFLSYFIDEFKTSVYDTLANIFLLSNRFDEAEKEISKCLSIEIREDDQKSEHNFTAAKIYFKKGDFSKGEKYYKKAIELGADDDSIKEFEDFLNDKELNQENNQIWLNIVNMRVNSMPFKLNSKTNEMSYFLSLDDLGLAHAEEYESGEDRIPKKARKEVALERIEGFLSIRDYIQANGTKEQKFHLDASIIGALVYAKKSDFSINEQVLKYRQKINAIESELLKDIF